VVGLAGRPRPRDPGDSLVVGRMTRPVALLVALLGCGCRPLLRPSVDAPKGDPSEAWEQVLGAVVTHDGYVDYDLLSSRRGPLDSFVAWLGRDRSHVDRENTQHAFWLNAYNALVLFAVLEDGQPVSVMDVPGWIPVAGSGFFYERAFMVQQQPTSLWEIEHERVRGRVMDLRDHAALNCATRSCPPLRRELYRTPELDEQLKDQMRAWLADDERGVRIEADEAVFSPIFDMYAWDFAFLSAGDDLCTLGARYLPGPKGDQLKALAERGCPHRFAAFDASLNSGR
jgi:hypothetical protein